MMAFDEADRTIRAYEVKRGNGQFDAGKIRSIKRDLMCIQVLLKSYAETANVAPIAAEAKIIFYYGVRSIPRPWSLVREDLDGHFGFPIVAKIEQANGYFRERLHQLLDAVLVRRDLRRSALVVPKLERQGNGHLAGGLRTPDQRQPGAVAAKSWSTRV